MIRSSCCSGVGWFDFGAFWRHLDLGFDPDWLVLVSTTLALLGLAALGAALVWLVATVTDGWRSRPVPQLDNPILEGATRDLARAVELLRNKARDADVGPLLVRASAKIASCSCRLSNEERRVLGIGWSIAKAARPGCVTRYAPETNRNA